MSTRRCLGFSYDGRELDKEIVNELGGRKFIAYDIGNVVARVFGDRIRRHSCRLTFSNQFRGYNSPKVIYARMADNWLRRAKRAGRIEFRDSIGVWRWIES